MITVDGVSKRFGNVLALDSVSMCIETGSRMVITGPSGSGKTTLLRLIAGLDRVDRGRILLDAVLVSDSMQALPPSQRGIGFVFQAPTLWPHLTVAQNILFGLAHLPGREAQARMEALCERLGIAALQRRRPHQLSGGEARRVSLARSLAPQPRFLLMDEPLTNLDAALKASLMGVIKEHLDRTGATLVYVTHSAEEAAQLADHALTLSAGHLVDGESLQRGS